MFDGGLIIVAGLLAYCLIEIRHWRGEYLREYERAEDFKGDVHTLSSRCRDLEATFLVLGDEADERDADLMVAEDDNTRLRAELKQVKEKYLHAVGSSIRRLRMKTLDCALSSSKSKRNTFTP